MMTPYVVTRYYRAPEVILGMGYKENGKIEKNVYSDQLGEELGPIANPPFYWKVLKLHGNF